MDTVKDLFKYTYNLFIFILEFAKTKNKIKFKSRYAFQVF